jgi:hypothetical protein
MIDRSERLRKAGRRSAFFGAGALAACVLALLAPSAARPAATATHRATLRHVPIITIRARIRVYSSPIYPHDSLLANREVTFTPKLINIGKVRILISNSDSEPHWFEINGVTSKRMRHGGRAVITVNFKRPGVYPVSVTSETPVSFSGQLKVIK